MSPYRLPPSRVPAVIRLARVAAGLVVHATLVGSPCQAATARIEYSVTPLPNFNNLMDGLRAGPIAITDSGRIYVGGTSSTNPELNRRVYYYESGALKSFEPVPGYSTPAIYGASAATGGFISVARANPNDGTALHSVYVDAAGNAVTHFPSREGAGTTYYYNTDGHGLFTGAYTPDVPPTTYFAGSVVRFADGSVKTYPNTSFTQVYDDGWMVGSVQEILEVNDGFILYKNRPTVWIKGEQVLQLVPSFDASFNTAFGVRSSDRTTMHGFLGISTFGGAAYLSIDGETHYLNQPETHRIFEGTELVEWFTIDGFNDMNDQGIAIGSADGRRFDHFTGSTEFYQTDGFAFRWDGQNGTQLLGDLIDPSLNLRIDGALSINNLGQILVSGHLNQPGPASNQWYLLTPVPEPSVAALSVVAGLLASRRRRAT